MDFRKFADEIANRFPEIAKQAAVPALESAADYLLEKIPEYPPETLGRLLPPDGVSWFITDRQRKWFFAAVRSGEVPGWSFVDGHPKKTGGGRTGNLGRSQTRDVVFVPEGAIATLGFDAQLAPYAPWVVGPDFPGEKIGEEVKYQARIHVDRWWQFAKVVEENVDAAWSVFDDVFWKEFKARLGE